MPLEGARQRLEAAPSLSPAAEAGDPRLQLKKTTIQEFTVQLLDEEPAAIRFLTSATLPARPKEHQWREGCCRQSKQTSN